MKETIEQTNSRNELLEGIIAADNALIFALKEQREALRKTVESLLNCVDTDRDIKEIRQAHKVLMETRY